MQRASSFVHVSTFALADPVLHGTLDSIVTSTSKNHLVTNCPFLHMWCTPNSGLLSDSHAMPCLGHTEHLSFKQGQINSQTNRLGASRLLSFLYYYCMPWHMAYGWGPSKHSMA
jgi:hypothetical protein